MIAISKSLDKKPSSRRIALRHFLEYHLTNLSIFLMIALFAGVVLYPHVVVTVPSGQVGLLWKRFGGGTVLDPRELRDEGLHFIFPWDILFLYDLRTPIRRPELQRNIKRRREPDGDGQYPVSDGS